MRDGDREIVNAKITGTTLGVEDHGVMSFWVYLEWRSCGQGLGGYALDMAGEGKERNGWSGGIVAIRKILETVGVTSWEKLPDTLVRLKVAGPGSRATPIIGHIMENKWFDMAAFAKENQ